MKWFLEAASAHDLASQLRRIDIEVPPRFKGRTTEQVERHSLVHWLAALPPQRLGYPLRVEHRDRPDCVLICPGRTIGLELTEAVPQNVVRAAILRGQGHGPVAYMTPHATIGERNKSRQELLCDIEADRSPPIWRDDELEHEWAKVMAHVVARKVEKTKKAGFALFAENWLLIYDNWPLPGVRHDKALVWFAEQCAKADVHVTFESIFVHSARVMGEVGRHHALHRIQLH